MDVQAKRFDMIQVKCVDLLSVLSQTHLPFPVHNQCKRHFISCTSLDKCGRSYLSICKDGCVVSLEAAFDQLVNTGAVDLMLLSVQVKHKVVRKGLVFTQEQLGLPGSNGGADVTSLNLFLCHLRPDPNEKNNT